MTEDEFVWDEDDGGDDESAFVWDDEVAGDVTGDEPTNPGSDAATDDGSEDAPLGGLADEIRGRRSGDDGGGRDRTGTERTNPDRPEPSGDRGTATGRAGRTDVTGESTDADEGPAATGGGGGTTADDDPASGGGTAGASGGTAGGGDSDDSGGGAAGGDGGPDSGAAAPAAGDDPGKGDPEASESPDDSPLGGLADEIRGRRAADAAEEEPDDESFEEREYQEIDPDRLWETLDDDSPGVATGEPAGAPPDAPAEGDVRVIPKRTCETCPHFAEPPTVACTHEGTDILEMVGVDEHKVVDCPMVVDDEVLDDGG